MPIKRTVSKSGTRATGKTKTVTRGSKTKTTYKDKNVKAKQVTKGGTVTRSKSKESAGNTTKYKSNKAGTRSKGTIKGSTGKITERTKRGTTTITHKLKRR